MTLNLDDEVLILFIEEAREHLSGIEGDLLDLETMGDVLDNAHINKIFRAIHSIKGGAGFWALDKIKTVSHQMETILNQLRNGEKTPNSDMISALLDGADMLKEMVNDIAASNDYDIFSVMSALEKYSGEMDGAAEEELDEIVFEEDTQKIERPADNGILQIGNTSGDLVFSIEYSRLNSYHQAGKSLYFAECDLITDEAGKEKPLSELLDELCQMGEIVESYVNVEAVGTLDAINPQTPVPFYFVFATIVEPDLIDSVIRIDTQRIIHIDHQNRLMPLGEDQPLPVPMASPEPIISAAPEQSRAKDGQEKREAVPKSETKKPSGAVASVSSAASSLRVNVAILDSLMNNAGELVLSRNQLKQAVAKNDIGAIEKITHQIDRVTSELQEKIMQTRMQSIDLVFNKFQRVVRDLSRDLGKDVNLTIDGRNVELDKAIIEAIGDPMTHLVRNALDHGIESPAERTKQGKANPASLILKAYHEAGQVYIEISDDGKGINPAVIKEKALEKKLYDADTLNNMSDKDLIQLIFAPGFSTAKTVTDVSGRGVGMDVVKSNLSQLGGVVDIVSQVGKGTTVRIKLPLTLAIIPSLIVALEQERYALPQVNMTELVRIPKGQVSKRLEKIHNNYMMRLRGRLLPVIHLGKAIGAPFVPPELSESVKIIIISTGELQYGLIVDELLDMEEIVVKPLGKHLRSASLYAGSTILGDGRAALILDAVNISRLMNIEAVNQMAESEKTPLAKGKNAQSLVIVQNSEKERFAIPLGLVSRIERIHRQDLEDPAGQLSIKYRDSNLLLFSIEQVAKVSPRADVERPFIIVFPYSGREVGIIVSRIIDAVDVAAEIDEETFRMPGILGSAIILGQTTMLLDVFEIVGAANPDLAEKFQKRLKKQEEAVKNTVLVVEDSNFFRNNMANIVKEAGYEAITAEDGEIGLQQLNENTDIIGVVLTDIEMPNMDGLEMTRQIRLKEKFKDLPIIACTSLAGELAEKRGYEAGVDDYLVKLDREKVTLAIQKYMNPHWKEQKA
jgi:two-component system, chemotaxis family, sensor kinase CheA